MADERAPDVHPRGSLALAIVLFVVVILGFGYLSVEFSGAITVNELNEIAAERREAAAPPAVPVGATDTRQMLAALDDEFGERTEALERLQFRSGPNWTLWVATGPAEDEPGWSSGPAGPGGLPGSPSGPAPTAFPGAPPRPGGPSSIGGGSSGIPRSSSRTFIGQAGEAPAELDAPEPPPIVGTFDLAEVTALRDLAAVDATARRAADLAGAVRGWTIVRATADGIEVEITYETGETGEIVARVAVDADGDLVEVRR